MICERPTVARLGNVGRPSCIPCARAHKPTLPITAHADPLSVSWRDSCASAPAWAAISINHAALRPAVHIMHPLRHLAIHTTLPLPYRPTTRYPLDITWWDSQTCQLDDSCPRVERPQLLPPPRAAPTRTLLVQGWVTRTPLTLLGGALE